MRKSLRIQYSELAMIDALITKANIDFRDNTGLNNTNLIKARSLVDSMRRFYLNE